MISTASLVVPTLHTTFFGVIAGAAGSATAINVTRALTMCERDVCLRNLNDLHARETSRYAHGSAIPRIFRRTSEALKLLLVQTAEQARTNLPVTPLTLAQVGALGMGAYNELVGGEEVQPNPSLSGWTTDDWHLSFAGAPVQGGMGEISFITFAATRKAAKNFEFQDGVPIDAQIAQLVVRSPVSDSWNLPIE